jgi:hypothetical protein
MLQSKYPNILGGREAVIRRADASDGTYFRVEIGPLPAGEAEHMCASLKAAGGPCVAQYE